MVRSFSTAADDAQSFVFLPVRHQPQSYDFSGSQKDEEGGSREVHYFFQCSELMCY